MASVERLSNMVNMMSRSIGDYAALERLSFESQQFGKRRIAIRWMKQVAYGFNVSAEARDSGIQIFDRFLALVLCEDDREKFSKSSSHQATTDTARLIDGELDPNIISYAAAVSMALGSKLHESKGTLSLLKFEDYDIEVLKHFERLVLDKLAFSISPQVTPFAFIRELLKVWEPENANIELKQIADALVADFWEETTSMLFAPSTIAIAALILSFSILRMDCTHWLSSIPNFCLPLSDNPLSNPDDETHSVSNPHVLKPHRNFHLFDIDRCLKNFKPVEASYSRRHKSVQTISPTGIADLSALETTTPLKAGAAWAANNNEQRFGEIDFGASFPLAPCSEGKGFKREKTATDNTSRNSCGKKRSFSMSSIMPPNVTSKLSVCLAGDLEIYMSTNKHSYNSIYLGERDKDRERDLALPPTERKIRFAESADTQSMKRMPDEAKRSISPLAKRQKTCCEMRPNSDNSTSSTESNNKYATVGLDIDLSSAPPSKETAKLDKRAYCVTAPSPIPLFSLQSALHLEPMKTLSTRLCSPN